MERLKTKTYDHSQLIGGEMDLIDCSLVIGGVPSVVAAMHILGAEVPTPDYYPKGLLRHLHREIWKGTVADLKDCLDQGETVFAKSVDWKVLTGAIHDPTDGIASLEGIPDTMPIWMSSVVAWRSEWRAYVIRGEVAGCFIYEGDEKIEPNLEIIKSAAETLQRKENGEKQYYAFDWGVLSTGETALIECNDGWAIGAYKGISHNDYYSLVKGRWEEIMKFRKQ